MSEIIAEIKKLLKENKLVIGANEVMKGLRTGKFEKVYLASNSPQKATEDIKHYADLTDVEVIDTNTKNTELGDICKKPFAISIIGLIKE